MAARPKLQLRTQGRRKAVCIGVSYRALPETAAKLRLTSTFADVDRVQRLLIDRFEYPEENITILKDDDLEGSICPTRENIMNAIQDLVAGARPGDRLVFHFSGHGSQKPNVDEKDFEKDGKDEAIWPSDVVIGEYADDAENVILDDTIRSELVDKVPAGAYLVIIFDCCHSGTAADLPHTHSDHSPRISHRKSPLKLDTPDSTAVMLSPTTGVTDDDCLLSTVSEMSAISTSSASTEEALITYRQLPTVVSWAACQDPNITISKQTGGLFVRAFDAVLRAHTNETSHEQLLCAIREKMNEYMKEILSSKQRKRYRKTLSKLVRPQLGCLHDYPGLLISPVSSVF